ncbi:MAG: dicarboxylate/amino acid:cation symporter [Lachnospiraceae bacterium]|nr:dicarboxylate/amino acid:cation symporter [Lachnospiraceae bacterium]
MKQIFKAELSGIPTIVETIEGILLKNKTEKQTRIKTVLAVEESATRLIEHSTPGAMLSLSVRRVLDDVTITMSAPGEKTDFTFEASDFDMDPDMVGPETESLIRNIVLKSFSGDIQYKHKAGANIVRLKTARSPRAFLYQTLSAIAAAVVFGMLLNLLCPEQTNAWIAANILGTVQTLFMNGLKMVVAPVVFLSITASITQFSDLRDVGRIGAKVIFLYFVTSVIAVAIGIAYSLFFQPGDPALAAMVSVSADTTVSETVTPSVVDTIKGIVTPNFLKSFVENDMLQLIFLAVLSGVALNSLGEKGDPVKRMFDALYEFFMKITDLFIRAVPIMVFCSVCSTLMTAGLMSIRSVLSIFFLSLFGFFTMGVVYCLFVAVIGRLNPLTMLRKYSSTMLQVFSLSSSNASISLNMEACDKKLGISPKLYTLSIPLGATLNMDGLCINLSVMALSLAHIFGVQMNLSQLVQVALTIIIISMGMPGIPGTVLIGLTMLLSQINVPVEAISLIMGIYAILDMFETASNCLGDVSATVVVARTEGMLDEKVFRKK